MRFVTAQVPSIRQAPLETTQILQGLFRTGKTQNHQVALTSQQVNPVAFLQSELAHKLHGQADGQKISPFHDPHSCLPKGYTASDA